jgi:hypothetical protein
LGRGQDDSADVVPRAANWEYNYWQTGMARISSGAPKTENAITALHGYAWRLRVVRPCELYLDA